MSPEPPPSPVSAWAPLRIARYRSFWAASFAMYVGIWMQNVGAAWLMSTLTTSPFLIASVQFATNLPVFLLSLPAGVLADQRDPRLIMLATFGWMVLVGVLVSVATFTGHVTPGTLLVATILLGTGFAVAGPAVQVTVSELVPRNLLPQAVTMGGVAFNTARSVGPALAGVILTGASSAWVFVASSVSVLAILVSVWAMPGFKRKTAGPPERLLSGMRTGIRYALHSPGVIAPLMRATLFGLCASAVWALLPLLVSSGQGGAGGFGLMVACLGAGAVLSAFLASWIRSVPDKLTFAAALLYAAAMFTAAFVPWVPVLCGLMMMAGIGWALTLNTAYATMQSVLPPWVRARVLSLYALFLQGSMAAGSLLWGSVAELTGVPAALAAAAVLLVGGMLFARWRYRLQEGTEAQVTPVAPWIEFTMADEMDPDEGPVAVEIEYRVDPARGWQFVQASRAVGRARKRVGAMFWRCYRDLEIPGIYRERFIVDSWADYLRSRERATLADRELEQELRAFHKGPGPVRVTHSIAEPSD
ncbi:MAG TPA: MFS transporter [Nevskiaceae bacterium]|nr:MFS transporter [Nevskiaceae bacterium]